MRAPVEPNVVPGRTIAGPSQRRPLSAFILLTSIVALGAGVRFWGLGFGLPHTEARPDEMHVIGVALSFLSGRFDPEFYDYPWFYMWLLAGLYGAYYLSGEMTGSFTALADIHASWPIPFFLISRALSAAAGTATVFVLYRLGRKLGGAPTGLVAAFFLSLAFLHVRDSHFGTTDIAMTLFVVTSVSLLVSGHTTAKKHFFALAGAVGGLATATKYNAVFVVAPMLVGQALFIIDSPGQRWRAAADARLLWYGVPFVAALLSVGMPYVFFDSDQFWRTIRDLAHSTRHGVGSLELDAGWLHHLKLSLRYGLGLPLLGAGLIGAAAMLRREWRAGLILLSFPISYYLVAGTVGNLFFRYAIPLVPFLCLFAAWLVTTSIKELAPDHTDRQSNIFACTTAVVAVAIVMPSALSSWRFDRIMSRKDNRVMIANWFKEHVRPGDSVLQSGSFYGHAQLDDQTFVPWIWDRRTRVFVVGGRRATGRPDWILLQDSPLPSMTQQIVEDFLKQDYQLQREFIAYAPDQKRIYDLQDAFFMPYAGFQGVKRPGPNFTLYRRLTTKAGTVSPSF